MGPDPVEVPNYLLWILIPSTRNAGRVTWQQK